MPNRKRPEVREEGRVMNNFGHDPKAVFDHLFEKYGVGDAPSLDTFKRWRREGKADGTWTPWRIAASALPATMMPARTAQVSEIDDAILHLSIIAAKRSVAEHSANSSSDTALIRAVLWDVHQQLEPGMPVLSHLRKSLRGYIKAFRANPVSLVSAEDAVHIEAIMKEVDDEE